MFNSEDFHEILRNLGKSVVSEHFRESFPETLSPRISYRISDSDLSKDPIEPAYKAPDSMDRASNFSIYYNKPKAFESRKTIIKKPFSSTENLQEYRENPSKKQEFHKKKLVFFEKQEENEKKPLIFFENPEEITMKFLLLCIEIERLEEEESGWKMLVSELEQRLLAISEENYIIKRENSLLKKEKIRAEESKITEIEQIKQMYDQRRKPQFVDFFH